jgi:DNA polymerase-3 subunit epsilon
MADVQATWEVLQAQLDRYDDLVPKVESLSEMSQASKFVDFAGRIIFDDAGEELFNFGRHKGKKVLDVFRKEPQFPRIYQTSDLAHLFAVEKYLIL